MSDALERLRNRSRPEVPLRDASLVSKEPDISTSAIENSEIVDTSTSRYPDNKVSDAEALNPANTLATKQSTMRLEAEISDRLQAVCRSNGLSREVLIEALFLHCEADANAWQSVIATAKKRAEHRQHIANLRRAQSMMEKFGP